MGTPNMGEGTSANKLTTYSILYGSFRRRVQTGAEGAVVRTLKKGPDAGKDVSELCFDSFAGYIKKVQLHSGEFSDDMAIDFATGDNKDAEARIYVPLYSSQGRSFINHILNANPKVPIKLTLWRKDADSRTYLYMAQWNGQSWEDVERKFSEWDDEKKMLIGLPPVIEGTKNGKPDWDYTEHTKALTDMFQKEILPAIQSESFLYDPKSRDEVVEKKEPALGGAASFLDDSDDLPFD